MDTRSLDVASERLRLEFDSLFPPEAIEAALRQSTDELVKLAHVDNFIPLLAERRTRERLVALTST